jgi:hypothetical protein
MAEMKEAASTSKWTIQLVQPTDEQKRLAKRYRNFVLRLKTKTSPNISFSESESENSETKDKVTNLRRQQNDRLKINRRVQRLHNILHSIHDDEILEIQVLTTHHNELEVVRTQHESYRQQISEDLQEEENVFLQAQQQQDTADDQSLGNLSTIEECNAFELRLREEIEQTNDSTPTVMRRYHHLLGKLEFKKMEVQDRAEATAVVNAARVRNDDIEVKRIKIRFAKYMKRLLKSADKEGGKYKDAVRHELERKRRDRMEVMQHDHEMELRKVYHAHESEIHDIQNRIDTKREELARNLEEEVQSNIELVEFENVTTR